MLRSWLFVLGTAVSLPVHAQLTAPVKSGDTTITVTGIRKSEAELSHWRVAETPHVVLFSPNREDEIRETARNLERLHFLLSALLGRVDAPDETIKIVVTMVGDAEEFEQLRLAPSRWQYGPFSERFERTTYYDPREEGPVLATTAHGVTLVLSPSVGRATIRNCEGNRGPQVLGHTAVRDRTSAGGPLTIEEEQYLSQFAINELSICQPAASRLYAGFAQHYLMTYFPAAYPRWFLQGFGEIFATMQAGEDFVVFGQVPPAFRQVMDYFGEYPVTDVLDGRYLSGKGWPWTPYHAWRLVHLLYFSDEWKPRLHEYLNALARGADPHSVASAFGNPVKLQRAVTAYKGRKLSFQRMTFPVERAPEPTMRRLTQAEVGLIRGRLELGARIEVSAGEGRERSVALTWRSAWLERLRSNARQYPDLIEYQSLLAEAECRSGNPKECLAAAERAIAQSPTDITALVWKGTALVQLAVQAPVAERQRRLNEARRYIVQANRLDPENILPLIAYYNSFIVAGEQAPDIAVEGLAKVVRSSPAAPSVRLKLGEELIKRANIEGARNVLLPVAKGPFDTPEQPAAAALLQRVMETESGS
jgi:hypothetical protein